MKMTTRRGKFRIGKDVKCIRRSIDLDIENFVEVSKVLLIDALRTNGGRKQKNRSGFLASHSLNQYGTHKCVSSSPG